MDSSRPPTPQLGRHQLATSQPPLDNGEGLSAYFSNLTGNPFFTAVRVIPPPHEVVCSSTPRALASQRLELQRASARKDCSMVPHSYGAVCSSTSKSPAMTRRTRGSSTG
jgi:hypothetical protein